MLDFLRGFRWPFVVYYLGVSILGFAALGIWATDLDPSSWIPYLTFLLLTIIADLVNLTLPRGGASVSVSTPVTFASIVILGPGAAAWVEALSALVVEGFINRRPPVKIFFNIPVLALSTGLAGMAFQHFPFGDLQVQIASPLILLPLLLVGVVHFAVNTSLVSIVIGLSDQRSPVRVWKTNYLWNLRHLLAFVPFTAIIVLVYKIAPWTLALFIIPLLLIKYAYKLYLDQREVHISTLSALATALDAKDPYTHGHSYRVSRYALLIGEGMGLADSQMQVLEYAALLHDIGKIGIQGSIISKPGKLTEAEFEDMKKHPSIGAEILQRLKFLEESARVVKYHHERPDGKGYPEGISGEEIPLMARILHLCDTFDAMTSNRPYREALSVERAIEEMQKYRGSQFDPEVVDVFVGLYNRGELEIIHEDIPFEVYEALNEA